MLLDDALHYCQLAPNKSAVINYGNTERAALMDDVKVPPTEREPYALLRVRTSQGWQFVEAGSVEAVKIQGREQGYGDLIDADHWHPYDQRKLFQAAVLPWATVLDCIECGIEGNREKARAYAELLLERLRGGGNESIARGLQRILEGRKGNIISPAEYNKE